MPEYKDEIQRNSSFLFNCVRFRYTDALADLHANCHRQRRRHSIADLPVLVLNVSVKAETIGKSLGSGTFSYTDDSCLFGMKNSALKNDVVNVSTL